MTALSVVPVLEVAVFFALTCVSLDHWRRRRGEGPAWLALTFAVLTSAAVTSDLTGTGSTGLGAEMARRGIIVLFAAFPYCLYRFTCSFHAGFDRRRPAAQTAAVVVTVASIVLAPVSPRQDAWSLWVVGYVVVFVLYWTALSLVSVTRLWRGGQDQPGVARHRMRMLGLAAVVLNLVLLLGAGSGAHASRVTLLCEQSAGLASGLLFLVSFAPPSALRARWRRREVEAFRVAEAELMGADTAERVAAIVLPHAAGLLGAHGAVLFDPARTVRATHHIELAQAEAIARRLPERPDANSELLVSHDLVALRVRAGWMALVTTASTPFLGKEELGLLRTLVHLAGLALDRAELFDRERAGRQALAEREAQLVEAQHIAKFGSYSWDLRNGHVNWSEEMHHVLGFTPDEVTDHASAFASRIHPDDRDTVVEAWNAARVASEPSSIEYRIVLDDSDTRWVSGMVRPVLDDQGKPVRLLGTLQDITERRRVEDELEQLRSALLNAVEGFSQVDTEGRYLWVNDAYASMCGYQPSEMVGLPWMRTVHPDDYAHVLSAYARMLELGREEMDARGMRKNGTTFHKHVVMVTARDAQGRFTGHYRTMQDVTARKQAEDQLRAALAREQDMVEELRELAKVKSDFVSTISHELRTPLTSITGYIELLADGDAGTLSPAQRDVLEVLDRNARRLMALIENLLTVSRMESGRLTIVAAPLDVVSLMDSVHQAVLPAAVSRGQTLRFDVDDDVGVLVADGAQIDRVLLNLLSNAIKFTPEGGEVAVTVRRSNDEVVFTVDDTGIGIAPEEQEELFSRFFRSSRATELAIQGTGLGLAIVKSIVDAHHGRISVQSTPGSGTEITVVLPANGPGGAERRDGNDAESDGAEVGGGAEVLAASGRSGTPA